MKLFKLLLLMFLQLIVNAQENHNVPMTKINAIGSFSINSNGIAPIPSFSLGKPAIITSCGFSKDRFFYAPALAVGLNFKPWYLDNWFYFKFFDCQKFSIKAGFNYNLFFNEDTLPGIHGHRYYTGALEAAWQPTVTSNFLFAYWYDSGEDKGSLKGHYISLSCEKSEIKLGNHLKMITALQLFYINYTENNDGLFVAPKLNLLVNNLPYSMFFQATQTIQTNIRPSPKFKWNIGLAYSL